MFKKSELKLEAPRNKNYCATVVKVRSLTPLDGCDNVVGTPMFGYQAIISKATEVGALGIVFPAETQLAEEFCSENNLFRHGDLNKHKGMKGYIEDNRRVKAVKFRGHRSDALFMGLESLAYTGVDVSALKEGDEFDILKGHEICQKYVVKTKEPTGSRAKQTKEFKRVDTKFIPEHYDSDNYFKNADRIAPNTEVVITQKLHGTSIRIANTIVKRKLNLIEKALQKLRVKIQEYEYDYVFGSRKVIKDANNPLHKHFYDVDIWSIEGKKLEGMLPQNCVVYGELIGWTPSGAPIQANYTYNIPQGECRLYVYRVAFVTEQGRVIELHWDHVKQFCRELGLNHVPELWRSRLSEAPIEAMMDKRYADIGYAFALPLGENKSLVDEGICIRVDTMVPYILKAKSPIFLQHESKLLDTGVADLEATQSEGGEDATDS
jgi:RNA ligase